jgi:pyridoxal phosphate enzyme (YggS family)
MSISHNLATVQKTIAETVSRCGRSQDTVKLVAVSKRKGIEQIKEAMAAGQIHFGENYLQEAADKIRNIDAPAVFHFIGHLQSNKVKSAVELFDLIETVDRVKIARAISRHAESLGIIQDVLIQVNIGREDQKSGVLPELVVDLLTEVNQFPGIRVRGFMTMPPLTDAPEGARPYFADLRKLAHSCVYQGLLKKESSVELSMGMSRDFVVAIEEGATLVRVGTAIFGMRD